jgi:hypothetical protein
LVFCPAFLFVRTGVHFLTLCTHKTEIDTLKRRFEEVVERTSIRREELREHRQEKENMKTDITDLKCRSMKNNLIFTGLFESPREYTEGIL